MELYKGSVSTVYKCLLGGGKTVVIKTYHKGKMVDKHFHKLEREIAAMRALCREVGRKGIVELLDTHEDAHGIHLVMECCEGGDLFKRLMIHGGKLPEHWVCVEVIAPLLQVLERMHSLHLMHRDIKPENIFITADGQVKLGDFGLAIDWTKELPFSRSGTLDYMAPEVLMNPATHTQESPAITAAQLLAKHIRPYTAAVDVWAVGCLAYELVCGRPPFEVEDEKQTASLIIYSNHIHFEPSASPLWIDFVTQALVKDPRQRPDATALLRHSWIRSNMDRAAAAATVPLAVQSATSDTRPVSDRSSLTAPRAASPAVVAVQASAASNCSGGSSCGPPSTVGGVSSSSSSAGVSSSGSVAAGSASPAAVTAQLQRTCTPSKAAQGFRTAAAMLSHRVSQSPSTPPAAAAASAPTGATAATTSPVTASGAVYNGQLVASGPPQSRSAPPTQNTAGGNPGLRPSTPGSSSGGGGGNSSSALRSLLDAFKNASMCSGPAATNTVSCTERMAVLSPPAASATFGCVSGAATHRPRSGGGGGGVYRISSGAGNAVGGMNVTTNVCSGLGIGGGGGSGSVTASQKMRPSFQFQLPSERDSARESGRESGREGRSARLSFHVQIPVSDRERERERDFSIGGSSTAAVAAGRTPSAGINGAATERGTSGPGQMPPAEYQAMLLGRPASPVQLPPQRSILMSSGMGSSGTLQGPTAAGCGAAAGAGSSPSRAARSGAATTGGLVPVGSQGGSGGALLSSTFNRPLGSLSAAGVCGRVPSPPPPQRPEITQASAAAAQTASPQGTQGKPPRPGLGEGSPAGKPLAAPPPAATASTMPQSVAFAAPATPIRASQYTSPAHQTQPPPAAASPPRLKSPQPQQQPPPQQPMVASSPVSSSLQRSEWSTGPTAAAAAAAGAAASPGSLHELTRNWGAVVSISVGKLSNLVAGGQRSGTGSAFSSPQRLPAGGKALDVYGLPAPTPVASALPSAEYCSPRPSGVLERVKHHLRGGGGGIVGGAAGGRSAGGPTPSSPTVSTATATVGAVQSYTALQSHERHGVTNGAVDTARVRSVDVT